MILVIAALSFIVLLFIGMPISFTIGLSAMIASFLDSGISPTAITTKLVTGIDTFALMAGAFFILAGEIMSTGSITKRLVIFSKVIIGRLRGGTSLTTVAASVFFAGISGAAVADLAAVGSMMTPAMKQEGYDEDFATALPVAASVVGPIIPPSTIMVIYAMATGTSIGALFIAGIVPGLLFGVAIAGLAYYYSVKRKYPRNEEPFPGIREFFNLTRKALLVLFMPIIIVGGVLSGAFTATESGNIAVVYALIISVFVYRDYKLKDLYRVMVNSSVTISIALLVISTASSLAWIFSIMQLPQHALTLMTSISENPYVFLMLLNLLLLVAGMFLDPGAAIILLAPMLVPLTRYFGIDPLHMAIVVCLNLTVGLITPPVGVCLYVGAGIGKISIERVVKHVFPFMIMEFGLVLLITYLPIIATALPRALGY
jgi:tripartite ATP-independent transporter DctM subunit